MDMQREIDASLRFIRANQEPFGHLYDTYEVDYFSGDRMIGSEKVVDYLGLRSFYEDRSYDELPVEIRAVVAIADWQSLHKVSTLLNELEGQAKRTPK